MIEGGGLLFSMLLPISCDFSPVLCFIHFHFLLKQKSMIKGFAFGISQQRSKIYLIRCFDLKLQKHVERYYVFIPLIGNIGLIDRDVLNWSQESMWKEFSACLFKALRLIESFRYDLQVLECLERTEVLKASRKSLQPKRCFVFLSVTW